MIPRTTLRELLDTHFNEGELRDLCFDLDIDYDNLPALSKRDKARELILHCQRTMRVKELEDMVRTLRPQYNAVSMNTTPANTISPAVSVNPTPVNTIPPSVSFTASPVIPQTPSVHILSKSRTVEEHLRYYYEQALQTLYISKLLRFLPQIVFIGVPIIYMGTSYMILAKSFSEGVSTFFITVLGCIAFGTIFWMFWIITKWLIRAFSTKPYTVTCMFWSSVVIAEIFAFLLTQTISSQSVVNMFVGIIIGESVGILLVLISFTTRFLR